MNTVFDTESLNSELKLNEPMSAHTSWKTGGPADFYYCPNEMNDLIAFLKQAPEEMPVTCIGNGSNLLVRDGGIRGVVISLANAVDEIDLLENCEINLGAGLHCVKAARFSAANGLTGSEFLAGIPGTIGGALAMNAGAYGSEIWDIVKSATVLNRTGECKVLPKKNFDIRYRNVLLNEHEWFIACRLQLRQSSKEICSKKIRALLSERAEHQPLGQLSCGSVFRNPENDYAARLIDACGLKGTCVGKACVSEKHANFIVNMGGASSLDIENLIMLVHDTVKRTKGFDLQMEVRIIGNSGSAVFTKHDMSARK